MPNRIRDNKNIVYFWVDIDKNDTYCIRCTHNRYFMHPSGYLKTDRYFYKTYREAIGILKKYFKIKGITRSTSGTHNNVHANISTSELDSIIS